MQQTIEKKGQLDLGEQPVNNLYILNENGDTICNIKDIFNRDEMVTGINIGDNGDLIVNTFGGVAYKVDVSKKEVKGRYITK